MVLPWEALVPGDTARSIAWRSKSAAVLLARPPNTLVSKLIRPSTGAVYSLSSVISRGSSSLPRATPAKTRIPKSSLGARALRAVPSIVPRR